MFSIGDKIVHPMHGGRYYRKHRGGKDRRYIPRLLCVQMPMNGLVLKIPTNNADAIGIRPIDSPEQIEAVFCMLPQLSSDMSNNWNRRYRENLAHLKSGDLLEVASVIKGLMHATACAASPRASGKCCTSPSRSSFPRSAWQKTRIMALSNSGSTTL